MSLSTYIEYIHTLLPADQQMFICKTDHSIGKVLASYFIIYY